MDVYYLVLLVVIEDLDIENMRYTEGDVGYLKYEGTVVET